MIKKSVLPVLFLLILSRSAFCASDEEMGQAAEAAGKLREALTHYTAALASTMEDSADDQRLREKIIGIVQKLDPPPAVPEEAKRFMVRGETLVKEAKSEADFTEAAAEFKQALHIAPWLSSAYFNLGLAEEGAGLYDQAIASFKLYLLASPAAEDAEKVKERIYALEVKWEKAQRQEEEKSEGIAPEELTGIWLDQNGSRWRVAVVGNEIDVRQESNTNSQWYEGTLKASNIEGFRLQDFSWCRNGRLLKDPLTGTVSSDGRTIKLKASGEGPQEIGANDMITRWFHYEDSTILTKTE